MEPRLFSPQIPRDIMVKTTIRTTALALVLVAVYSVIFAIEAGKRGL